MRITLKWALSYGSKTLQLLTLTVHNGNSLERIRAFNFTMCILLCVVEDDLRELLLLWAMYLISLYSIQFLNLKPLCVYVYGKLSLCLVQPLICSTFQFSILSACITTNYLWEIFCLNILTSDMHSVTVYSLFTFSLPLSLSLTLC